jgi:hypothetical protein
MINNRGQLKLARENHKHQSHLETQKLEYEQRKEAFECLQEKLDEAERIVLKIETENSLIGSVIMREGGISIPEWNAQYLKLDEDMRRLQMMADLYFPKLQEAVSGLQGKVNVLWGRQRQLLYVESEAFVADHLEDMERQKSFKEDARGHAWVKICDISEEVGAKVWEVRNKLRQVAEELFRLIDEG